MDIRQFVSDKKFYLIILVLITLIGGFLRFYRLPEIMPLTAEQGDNYLAIKNIVENRTFPLVGPPTSHKWLDFGPLFYYLMTPIMLIANYNPLAPAYFFALLYTAIVPINYIVVKKIFNKQTGLLSSFLITISPIWLHFSRSARFFCLVPFLFYFFLWEMAKEKKNFFLIGLLLGTILNFHLTPLMLIPALVSFFWIRKTKVNWKLLFLGFLLPLLPLLIYDSMRGLQMTKNFLLWIPYRIAGFSHLYPKNNLTLTSLKQTIQAFYQFLQRSFFPKNFPWQISLSIYLVLVYLLTFNTKKVNFKKARLFLLLAAGWGTIALLVHTQPPLHYFLPILSLPQILLAYFLANIKKNTLKNFLIATFLLLTAGVNFLFYFSQNWFYHPTNKVDLRPHYVPYFLQRKITAIIVHDADGKAFHISRTGPHDQFENDFADNYYYLAWLMGKEPVYSQKKAEVVYQIIENPEEFPASTKVNEVFIQVDDVGILKKN